MAYDIVIKNGTIIDGSGSNGYEGAVAITSTRIQEVGANVSDAGAKHIIDARGKVVCPGFIDVTNHSDTTGTLFRYPAQESMIRQGVTTILGGNCGSSLAPLLRPDVINSLQKWQMESSITADWLTVGEYLRAMEKVRPAVNVATLVGWGTIRRGLLPSADAELTYDDLSKAKYVLRQGLADGAFGLSTGLVYAHERNTSTEDLISVASVLKEAGGVYKTHLRSESGNLLGAVNEAISIGREAGVPVSISHFKAIGRKAWRDFHRALELLEHAAASGLSVQIDAYPYISTGSFLYLLLPAGAYEGGFAMLFRRLRDGAYRNRIADALRRRTLHYESIVVSNAWRTKESIGRSIRDLSDRIGISPEEVILQLLLANEGRVNIFGRTVRREHVRETLEHPLSVVASDGSGYALDYRARTGELVHPRSFGAFPRFIRLATHRWGSLTLPRVIEKATSAPARFFGIAHRGRIEKGAYADVVVFDADRIRSAGTFENPYQYPEGIEWVIVNGSVAVRNGRLADGRHGMVLRRGSP